MSEFYVVFMVASILYGNAHIDIRVDDRGYQTKEACSVAALETAEKDERKRKFTCRKIVVRP